MKVTTKEKAWKEASVIFTTDYEKDYAASEKAGYDIYKHPVLNPMNYICDLGARLEVITGENGKDVINIWIDGETKITKETRRLQREDLRRLCISKNWYTRGTKYEYEALLNEADNCLIDTQTIVYGVPPVS